MYITFDSVSFSGFVDFYQKGYAFFIARKFSGQAGAGSQHCWMPHFTSAICFLHNVADKQNTKISF